MKVLRAVRRLAAASRIHLVSGQQGSVLLFSMRRIADLVAFCAMYEFEDTIAELTGADRVEPENIERLDLFRKTYKLARLVTRSPDTAARLTPWPAGLRLDRNYDLFFPVFNNPYEIFALNAVPRWRERCGFAACYVSEIWGGQGIPEYLLESLARFDRIYVGVSAPVAQVQRITGRPCSYMLPGVDALRFSPYPVPPDRCIDVCGIGRRSAVTHAALLALARERRLFYYYDTIQAKAADSALQQVTFSVTNPSEHRLLLSDILKRSRYFLASRARATQPDVTGSTEEIPYRFFEGAAAGTVMLGAPPRTEAFRTHFGWPKVVVEMPVDCPGIGDVIARLDADPEGVAKIRRDNVSNSLLRHDWVYRLGEVFDAAGLPRTPAMLAREARLRDLAGQIRAGDGAR